MIIMIIFGLEKQLMFDLRQGHDDVITLPRLDNCRPLATRMMAFQWFSFPPHIQYFFDNVKTNLFFFSFD
jgi:hypothetical protein